MLVKGEIFLKKKKKKKKYLPNENVIFINSHAVLNIYDFLSSDENKQISVGPYNTYMTPLTLTPVDKSISSQANLFKL